MANKNKPLDFNNRIDFSKQEGIDKKKSRDTN